MTKVKAITLNQILSKLEQVDLIDLDVQGAELAVLRSGIEELNKKVKRVHYRYSWTVSGARARNYYSNVQ